VEVVRAFWVIPVDLQVYRDGGLTVLDANPLYEGPLAHDLPLRTTIHIGQVNLLLLAVILWGLLRWDNRWSRGIGLSIMAGIKLTPLFVLYLLATKRFRAASVATGAFLATLAAGFRAAPSRLDQILDRRNVPRSRPGLRRRRGTTEPISARPRPSTGRLGNSVAVARGPYDCLHYHRGDLGQPTRQRTARTDTVRVVRRHCQPMDLGPSLSMAPTLAVPPRCPSSWSS
jgi:hypothetical protein